MTVVKRRLRRYAYAAAVLAFLVAARAGADPAPPTGSVVVTVRDTTGVIPGASVRLVPAIGPPVSVVSDERGQARFDAVPAGDCDVSATVQGYADATRRLAVQAGQGHDVELALSVGQFSVGGDRHDGEPARAVAARRRRADGADRRSDRSPTRRARRPRTCCPSRPAPASRCRPAADRATCRSTASPTAACSCWSTAGATSARTPTATSTSRTCR